MLLCSFFTPESSVFHLDVHSTNHRIHWLTFCQFGKCDQTYMTLAWFILDTDHPSRWIIHREGSSIYINTRRTMTETNYQCVLLLISCLYRVYSLLKTAARFNYSAWLLRPILQHWPVFPSAEAASLILAQVSSSSLLLVLSCSSLNFNSCHISSANFSRGLSNWRLLVGREMSLVFSTQCNLHNINVN